MLLFEKGHADCNVKGTASGPENFPLSFLRYTAQHFVGVSTARAMPQPGCSPHSNELSGGN